MQCKELESLLEAEGLEQLDKEARVHLAACGACQGLVADLESIISAAKALPAEVAPPDRIWISLRAQLEAEGLIKEPTEVAGQTSVWESIAAWMKPRTIVTAAAAALVLAAAIFLARVPQRSAPEVVKNPPVVEAPRAPQPAPPAPATEVHTNVATQEPARIKTGDLAPSPSESASFTLNQAELDVPDMQLAGNSQVDASLRQNLRTLNAFIAECEQHLKQNPQDELAREYLNTAYQQKADLLAAMMESGRGDN